MEIKIKIDGKEYTMDEARELYNTLAQIFATNVAPTYIPPPPVFGPSLYGPPVCNTRDMSFEQPYTTDAK